MEGDNSTTEENNADWRDNQSLSGCAEHYFQKGIETDVDFIFKKYSDRKMKAHRIILSMRSAVFEAMFFGPMADNRKEIDIEDIEPDVFDLMLRYIYKDKVDLKGETVLKCLYAGRKYCLSGLVNLCSSFLENSISPENVCTIYEQSRFFDVEDLSTRCYSFITQSSEAVFQSEDLKNLSYESMLKLLSDDNLQSEEILHFEMVLGWADAKCQSENTEPSVENIRKVLGDIIEKIRFPVIPPEVFVQKVIPTHILSPEEENQLLQFMVTMTTKTPGQVGRFSSYPRHNILAINLEDVGYLTIVYSKEEIHLSSNCDIDLISCTRIAGEFETCFVKCLEDNNLNRYLPFKCFDYDGGKLCCRPTTDNKIRLLARKMYQLHFKYRRQPDVSSRKMNHVAKFGELSITINEVPEDLTELRFCRV